MQGQQVVYRGRQVVAVNGIELGDRIYFVAPWDSEVHCTRTVVRIVQSSDGELFFITQDSLQVPSQNAKLISEEYVS